MSEQDWYHKYMVYFENVFRWSFIILPTYLESVTKREVEGSFEVLVTIDETKRRLIT
jgi:hypothetical protein